MSTTNGASRSRQPKVDLVGTAEAASILGVERPRIGRWIKRGVMPDEAVVNPVAATPLWRRSDIEAMRDWVGANRRHRVKNACACGCGEEAGEYAKTDRRRGQVKGEPREFIQGHEKNGAKVAA